MPPDTLVRGGTVVFPERGPEAADIVIRDGRIAAVQAPGETGAARLLHLLERFNAAAGGDTLEALTRLDALIALRSDYVRALNIIVSDGRSFFINCRYSEEQDYFTLRTASVPSQGLRMVSSEAISTGEVEPDWLSIPNHTTCALGAESKCCS